MTGQHGLRTLSRIVVFLALTVALPLLPAAAHAQQPGPTIPVVYLPGWNMVGGPANSNFGMAEALFHWNAAGQAYVNDTGGSRVISSMPPACTGYWAYFPAAIAVQIPLVGPAGATASCSMQSGWNLVGNPFSSAAQITTPSNVTAFHWDPVAQVYNVVSVVPAGASVWIFNDGGVPVVTLRAT